VNSSARLKESMELFINNIIHTYGVFSPRKLNSVFVALSRSESQKYLRQHVASAVLKNQFVIKQEKRMSLNQFVFNHPLVLFSALVPRDFYTLTVVCGSHKVKDSKLATIVHRKDVVQVVIPFGWLFLIGGLVFHSGQESDGINSQARLHAQILHKDMKLSDYRLPEERIYFAEGVKYCDVNTVGCSKCSTHLESLDNKIIRDDEVFNVLVPCQESEVLNGSGTALAGDLVNDGFCWIRVALSIPSQPFSSHLKEFCTTANNWGSLTCGNLIYKVKTPDAKRHQNCMYCDIKATKTYIDSFMSEQDHKSDRLQS
jgi:hypothetical protein